MSICATIVSAVEPTHEAAHKPAERSAVVASNIAAQQPAHAETEQQTFNPA